MQIQSVDRQAVLAAVRDRAEALKGARDSVSCARYATLVDEVTRLAEVPGSNTGAMREELDRRLETARGRRARRLCATLAMGAVAAATTLVVAHTFGPGPACIAAEVLGLPTLIGAAATREEHQAVRREEGTLRDLERWAAAATDPPGASPDPWLSLAGLDGSGPNRRGEVLALMGAARSYLQANPQESGANAALRQVETDLRRLSKRPDGTLGEVLAGLDAENQRLEKLGYRLACGGMVSILATLGTVIAGAPIAFGAAPALAAGMLCTAGMHYVSRRQKHLGELRRNLEGWDAQLSAIKQPRAEVHRMANPEQGGGIRREESYVVVGAVRIPVAA
ncbi:MAG: hypothetical protein AB1758_02570 [Candidatus Eremiobacterota bacterium]